MIAPRKIEFVSTKKEKWRIEESKILKKKAVIV